MKLADGTYDNTNIIDRNKKKLKVVPGDLNDIARKRQDTKSQQYSEQGCINYDEINWNSKKRRSA